MTALDLAAIETRAAAATPGPWTSDLAAARPKDDVEIEGPTGPTFIGGVCTTGITLPDHVYDDFADLRAADVHFVTHAREDVPALVSRVRELEAALRFVLPHAKPAATDTYTCTDDGFEVYQGERLTLTRTCSCCTFEVEIPAEHYGLLVEFAGVELDPPVDTP